MITVHKSLIGQFATLGPNVRDKSFAGKNGVITRTNVKRKEICLKLDDGQSYLRICRQRLASRGGSYINNRGAPTREARLAGPCHAGLFLANNAK